MKYMLLPWPMARTSACPCSLRWQRTGDSPATSLCTRLGPSCSGGGDVAGAEAAYRTAIELTRNTPERAALQRRAAELGPS